jgi:hypothetical protein
VYLSENTVHLHVREKLESHLRIPSEHISTHACMYVSQVADITSHVCAVHICCQRPGHTHVLPLDWTAIISLTMYARHVTDIRSLLCSPNTGSLSLLGRNTNWHLLAKPVRGRFALWRSRLWHRLLSGALTSRPAYSLLLAWPFDPDDRGSMFLRNVVKNLTDYTV